MKKLIVLFFIAFPLVSFGDCLELSGSFTCLNPEEKYQWTVSTKITNGVYSYEFTDLIDGAHVFIADGNERTFEVEIVDGIKIRGTRYSICNFNSLKVHHTGVIDGEEGVLKLESIVTADEGIIKLSHIMLHNSQVVKKWDEKCTPN